MSEEFKILKENGKRLRSEFESLKIDYLKKEEELKLQQKLEAEQAHTILVKNIKNEYEIFKENNLDLISQMESTNLTLKDIQDKINQISNLKKQQEEFLLVKNKLIEEYKSKKCPNLYEVCSKIKCINVIKEIYTDQIIRMDPNKNYITENEVLKARYNCKCDFCYD